MVHRIKFMLLCTKMSSTLRSAFTYTVATDHWPISIIMVTDIIHQITTTTHHPYPLAFCLSDLELCVPSRPWTLQLAR